MLLLEVHVLLETEEEKGDGMIWLWVLFEVVLNKKLFDDDWVNDEEDDEVAGETDDIEDVDDIDS